MRILLTNDDGIHAPGIAAMHDALADTGEHFGGPLLDKSPGAVTRAPRSVIVPIAPLTVQSATGHGVTFREPLMVRPEELQGGVPGTAVDGRPADCVKLAISSLWPERFGEGSLPDLLVSGINAGANVGINVIYSGTVAAALEGAFLGVPAIAVSLHIGGKRPDFAAAARHARRAIEALIAGGLPAAHECLSINIPVTEADGPPPPIRVCPMNTHGLVDKYDPRVSPAGGAYYWASGHGLDFRGTEPASDVAFLLQRCITVTPLTYDLTRHATLDKWRSRLA
ncbi:MAG: 5'/3'-nucleotidase SurE [Phycisphaerales bacterium]|nr:5'/3'-nucleotidase SurE [Phycisphaerales bacterium]